MMTDLMLMAVACDQTRVFNMFYASAFSATTQPGYDKPHHTATHEEAVDRSWAISPIPPGIRVAHGGMGLLRAGPGQLQGG